MHFVPATQKQRSYIRYLLDQRGIFRPLPDKLEKYDASLMIGRLTGRAKKQTDSSYVNTWQERKYQEELARKINRELVYDD